MVQELKVPEGAHRADLLLLWPVVLSDVLSVVNIGIYWNNHPHMFHSVRHLGGGWVLWANLRLLFGVSYSLLTAALVAEHGRDRAFARALGPDTKGKFSLAADVPALGLAFVAAALALIPIIAMALSRSVPDRRFATGTEQVWRLRASQASKGRSPSRTAPMPVITCIEDLRQIYHRKAPKMFVDYCEAGSYSEQTLRDNTGDFAKIRLRQRVARDLSDRTTDTLMIGQRVALPVALAPVGSCGMQTADGEIKAARAAAAFGVPFTLSTMSVCSIEDVAAHAPDPFWFQLYVMRDEDFVDAIIDRAQKARCSALVITLDLQVLGQRHKDVKNGLSPPKLTLPNMINMALHPEWSLGMLGTPRRTFRNIVGHVKGVGKMAELNTWANANFDPKLDWSKVRRIRDQWGGKLILKGVLDAEDARMALDVGADALVVSNHGGRQLDGALSTIRALPPIVRAVGEATEVWMDGGIRSGQDVLKALALGAKGVMIGRSFIYGLGAMGQAGVAKALEVLRAELDISMALCGVTRIRNQRSSSGNCA